MERKSIALLFFVLIVLGAQDMVVKTEAQRRTCEALSGQFRGGCVGSTGNVQCDRVCRRIEGLLSGRCKGLQCYCTRVC